MEQNQKIVDLSIKKRLSAELSKEKEENRKNTEYDLCEIIKKALKSLKNLENAWEINNSSLAMGDEISLLRFYLNVLDEQLEATLKER
ncbi:MAG: hypothetical protein NZ583_06470 [Desulfobacterota bacterium]|nr:hypothetical protein [Thermodesulfobacteriota bacterium]MDW8002478.1 hypothetical protein [Deltaproteobacteria bacterium]